MSATEVTRENEKSEDVFKARSGSRAREAWAVGVAAAIADTAAIWPARPSVRLCAITDTKLEVTENEKSRSART